MSSATPTDPDPAVLVRPAVPADADAIAEVHLRARRAAPMPVSVHSDDDVRAWLAGRLGEDDVWVAERDAAVVGYARFTATWLDDLYVDPSAAGQGVGRALLEVVKALRPDGFGLWVFESNVPARRFYERAGLVAVERTDGSANEEGEPDVRMVWRPTARRRRTVGAVD